jgi:hypothetical protein
MKMKKQPINTNKDSSSSDKNDHELEQLLNDLIAHLKKSGTICGTGDEMEELRRKKFG